MKNGIEYLDSIIGGNPHLVFEEKLVMITGTKPADGVPMGTLIVQEEGPPYGHCG